MRLRFYTATLLLLPLLLSSAGAQVSSHKPSGFKAKNAMPPAQKKESADRKPLVPYNDDPVAKVNGVVLTNRDLLREMYIIFPYAAQHSGFPKDLEAGIRQGALEMIIFEELVYQDALRRKIEIPASRLQKALAEFKKQFHGEGEYQAYLRAECKGSEKVLEENLRRSLLIETLLKREVESRSEISEADAKAYYKKNIKEFTHSDKLHIQTISIIPPRNPGVSYEKEARKEAEDALKKAKATKSFQEFGLLAEKVSDDDWHVNMGNRRDVDAKNLPPPIVEAARKMKPGEVSDLFQFGPNFTIFRLVSFTPAHVDKFSEVEQQIREKLKKIQYDRERSAFNKRLRKSAKVEVL